MATRSNLATGCDADCFDILQWASKFQSSPMRLAKASLALGRADDDETAIAAGGECASMTMAEEISQRKIGAGAWSQL